MLPKANILFGRFSLATLLLVSACGGRQGASRPAGGAEELQVEEMPAPADAQQEESAGESLAESLRRERLSHRSILADLPGERSIVMHLSWSKLATSDFFQEHRDVLMKSLDPQVAIVRATCGFDPYAGLDSITLALGPDPQNTQDTLMAAKLRIPRSQIEDCIRKSGGRVEEGKYHIDGDTMHVLWTDEHTLLFSAAMSQEEMLGARAKGRARDQESLMEFLRKTDSHATFWGGGSLDSKTLGAMGGSSFSVPRGFHFSVNAFSGVDAAIALIFSDEDGAKSTKGFLEMGLSMMGTQLPMGEELSKAIQLEQFGNAINIDFVMTSDEVSKLIETIRAM